MHKALGTLEQGAVRFTFSHYNTDEEVDAAVKAVRELAAAYGAKTVELKYFYDDDDNRTETNVVDFMKLYSEELDRSYFIFRNELNVPSCTPRKFINYTESEIFTTA